MFLEALKLANAAVSFDVAYGVALAVASMGHRFLWCRFFSSCPLHVWLVSWS